MTSDDSDGPASDGPAADRPASEGVARDAETIVDALAQFEGAGYAAQLVARAGAEIECLTCRETSSAADFRVHEVHRLEGVSDPDDMLAIAALACPVCESRGTLVVSYGPQTSAVDADVLAALESTPPPPSG